MLEVPHWRNLYTNYTLIRKQPSRGVLRKCCSENMQQIYYICNILCYFKVSWFRLLNVMLVSRDIWTHDPFPTELVV